MYPSLPYFDIQVIEGLRNLGVGYIFLLLHNLYLKKKNKVLEEDAYNTKIISLKKSTRERSFVLLLCSLFQGRVHAGTLYLYSSKLSTLSTFVKIYLLTLVKNTDNCQHSQLLLNCQHSQNILGLELLFLFLFSVLAYLLCLVLILFSQLLLLSASWLWL